MLNVPYIPLVEAGGGLRRGRTPAAAAGYEVDAVDQRRVEPHELPPAVAGHVDGVLEAQPGLLAGRDERHVDHRRIEERLAVGPAVGSGVWYPCGSCSASARQSVRPFVCTPLLARKTMASPSATSPGIRLRLRGDPPEGRAAEDHGARRDHALQGLGLAAAPRRPGSRQPSAKPSARSAPASRRRSTALSPTAAYMAIVTGSAPQEAEVVGDRGDVVDRGLPVDSSRPVSRYSASATRIFVPSASSTCAK